MIIPRPIRKGDTLGVTAPSFGVDDPLDAARFSNAKSKLAARGYRVRETPDVYTADETGRSAPAGQRVSELVSLLEDGDVSCVFSAKGGDYQFEMLPLMDWGAYESDPKWFQGYSDNTTLMFKMTAEHDVATVYCGNFGDFGMDEWHPSLEQNLEFLEGVRGEQCSFPYHATDFVDRVTGLESFQEDEPTVWGSSAGDCRFSGRLIGGCMDVLEWFHAKGTADPTGFVDRYGQDGIVWYMETFDMTEDRIRSMIRGMEGDGWFADCTGFVFGRPLFYHGETPYRELVEGELAHLEVPVLTDADVGHKAPRMTFINGAMSEFEYAGGACTLSYRLRGAYGGLGCDRETGSGGHP